MSYSFKDDIASRLPEGYTVYQIYSFSDDITRIEGIKGVLKTFFELKKVDLTNYFSKIPTVTISATATLNDLYRMLSDIFDLGLLINIDYYDSTPLKPSSVAQYVELPISNNSYGYKGMMRCYVVTEALTGINMDVERDVTSVDVTRALNRVKFRNFIMGCMISSTQTKFVDNALALEFVNEIIDQFSNEVDADSLSEFKTLLSTARVVEKYSDDISDIVVIISNQELFQIRYLEPLKNNGASDNTSDSSQGLPDEDTDSSAENPVSGEGDINNTEQSEDPYSSTEGNIESDMEIDIG